MAFDISKFAATAPQASSDSDLLLEIPIDDIAPNPRNFYPRPAPADMISLRDSIEANGLLEPLTVVAAGGGTYCLISGHSRMAAIRELRNAELSYEQTSHRWDTVPCRVLPPMSEVKELTAVIEANRQRVKTPALLANEAEQLAQAYEQRQKAGEKLPGGIRAMVAKALHLNATKVSNLRLIKKGLKVPGIITRWERDELPEAAALVIAKMDIDTQYRLLDWMIATHNPWTIRAVGAFDKMWTLCEHDCPYGGGLCAHAAEMIQKRMRHGAFYCSGCCDRCHRTDCPIVCEHCQPEPEPEPEKAPPLPTEPPEGQLVISGWMPGGCNPAEPGTFAVLGRMSDSWLCYYTILRWDGEAWTMQSGDRTVREPVWWMRLPPIPEEADEEMEDI